MQDTITLDPATVLSWVQDHKWAPIIALIVGFAVRLLKDDTKLPASLPAIWRPWFALVLSMVGADCVAVLGGAPWASTIETGAIACLLAILGHETVVEGVRKGIEIPIPWLTKPAPTLQTLPPPPPTGIGNDRTT